VAYNNVTTLAGFVRGLESQGPAVRRVVVVDNASTDETLVALQQIAQKSAMDIVVVANVNNGFAGGYARGGLEVLDSSLPTLCLNPDVELVHGSLNRMLEALQSNDRVAIVTSPLVTDTGEPDSASRRMLPTLGKAAVYAVLGRLTPSRFRYNRRDAPLCVDTSLEPTQIGTTPIEATTGALMLVNPGFRPAVEGIFDQDYWMYGEDLQLCRDAAVEGWRILMAEGEPSVHLKGVSSGRPRGRKSNIEFHRAMYIYYRKNLNRHSIGKPLIGSAIFVRLAFELMYARLSRLV
jgi:N-acetylglucosaminyl-diphospho-decaprenol L-rhamnosyltransferase